MSQKLYGVVRVMNTITQGAAVAGLEAGSAVFSKEATEAVQDLYGDCIVAVTNHHVVGEQKQVMLNFHFNQTPFPASVLHVCPQYDLAFLHINTFSPEFRLANFNNVTKTCRDIELIEGDTIAYNNQEAFAKVTSVGFPLGTPHQTITKGHITARDTMNNNVVLYHDNLINPGNSGGALLHEGKLVGINTAITTQPNTVSVATPFEVVESLLPFLTPTIEHESLSSNAMRQLLAVYNVSTPPEQLIEAFNKHSCGGLNEDQTPVSFSQWFYKHCYNRPESHHLLQNVLSHLETDPSRVHTLREQGWIKCANHSVNCKLQPANMTPNRIVFQDHFSISPTIPIMDKLTEKYGAEGVVITNAHAHENVQDGQVLLGIDGRNLDNFGNFCDNGAPYFTAFKYKAGESVNLHIGTDDGIQTVSYTYNLLKTLPRIHAPQLTPFEPQTMIQVGGLTITQMNAAMAKASYPKYLTSPHNNKVVGVVVQVHPLSPEWNVQKISPGFLLTKVNGKEMQGSIEESLQGASFLTFESKKRTVIKLVA